MTRDRNVIFEPKNALSSGSERIQSVEEPTTTHLHSTIGRIMAVVLAGLICVLSVGAQAPSSDPSPGKPRDNNVVVVTGARFCYPLVQHWIDDYNKVNPNVQIIIESRGSADPAQYDILVDAFESSESVRKTRAYVYVARYAILPVANSKSAFARMYRDKGLTQDLIKQIFFHDLYADKKNETKIKAPYTVYTRLQKAGVPIVFTHYFGYEQKDIKGKAIAGADEHLLKALTRDTTGVTYLPMTLVYDHLSGKALPGLSVLPVDLNGNGRVSTEEKSFDSMPAVIQLMEISEVSNIPVGDVHLSVPAEHASPVAVAFLQWVINQGKDELHSFGYLKPVSRRTENEKFKQLSSTSN